MNSTITVNSYFSGAGLFDIGLLQGGLMVGQSFELDRRCCETQRANFSHEVVQADIAQKLVSSDAHCEVKAFTYPCTKYSPIADIHGTRTGDELFLHALRHMVLQPPEAFVIENVPGMKKFPIVMEAMTRLPDYYVRTFCPVGTQTWLPQVRNRLIIIGTRRPFDFREPTGRRVKLAKIVEAEPRVDLPDYLYKRLDGGYRDRPIVSDPARDDIAPTCVAHYAKDVSTRLIADRRFPHGVRPYSVREYARLQGVPDSFKFCGTDRQAYRMIGNGVSVPVGRWVGQELRRYFRGGRRA